MKKRIVNRDDYPMVLNWDGYKNTHSILPCKCQLCEKIIYKTINRIDYNGDCYCYQCGITIKRPKTCIERFGVSNPMKSDIIVKKLNKTNQKKYGANFPFQSKEIQKKVQETHFKLHGFITPTKSKLVQNKTKETNLLKYKKPYHLQKNREDWQIKITSSKENFEKYLSELNKKPTVIELREHLGFSKNSGSFWGILSKWELYEYIDSSSSNLEKELLFFINLIGIKTQRKRFKWGEIDIYISELKIGFEFNGDYWHSDKKVHKNYHYNKITNAQNEGIRLIHIWEHEWLHNQDQIKSYIKAQLGLYKKRIFARKCEVREIDYQTAKPLLEYHQQKTTTAQVYLGLYHQNELVLCMLLSKTTKNIFTQNPIAEWEVKREVCKEEYIVVGGKSKTFKYFLKKYNPKSVVSYVDRSKFTGKSYEIMGFKLVHINPARYDWVHNGSLIFKKRQPKIYKEMKQLYDENKVFRIYDSGRYCFIWESNNN